MYVVRAVDELVNAKVPRLTREDNGGTGKGKVITVTYIGKPYTHRAPAVMVMPVLPQVQYGGIQRTTINYRNSSINMKVSQAFDGDKPTTLYTRKE
jgi:hypothetical protein